MTPEVTVAQLDRELLAQAAVAHRAIVEEQARADGLETQLGEAGLRIDDLTAELAGVRAELERVRAELQWLRRAGVDLNEVMELRVVRAARTAGRIARSAREGRRRPAAGA